MAVKIVNLPGLSPGSRTSSIGSNREELPRACASLSWRLPPWFPGHEKHERAERKRRLSAARRACLARAAAG